MHNEVKQLTQEEIEEKIEPLYSVVTLKYSISFFSHKWSKLRKK